ncbi:MAG: hypothetical protein VB142_03045 [Burkholderia sp.]
MVSIIFEVMDTTLLDTEKSDSRKGRPNHSQEFQRRIGIARVRARCFSRQTGSRAWSECESGVHPGGTGIVPSKGRQRQRWCQ